MIVAHHFSFLEWKALYLVNKVNSKDIVYINRSKILLAGNPDSSSKSLFAGAELLELDELAIFKAIICLGQVLMEIFWLK